MFKLISDAVAQTTQTATDAANKVTEVATSYGEYVVYAALAGLALYFAYRIWNRA